jgi:hypothetical protein
MTTSASTISMFSFQSPAVTQIAEQPGSLHTPKKPSVPL